MAPWGSGGATVLIFVPKQLHSTGSEDWASKGTVEPSPLYPECYVLTGLGVIGIKGSGFRAVRADDVKGSRVQWPGRGLEIPAVTRNHPKTEILTTMRGQGNDPESSDGRGQASLRMVCIAEILQP